MSVAGFPDGAIVGEVPVCGAPVDVELPRPEWRVSVVLPSVAFMSLSALTPYVSTVVSLACVNAPAEASPSAAINPMKINFFTKFTGKPLLQSLARGATLLHTGRP